MRQQYDGSVFLGCSSAVLSQEEEAREVERILRTLDGMSDGEPLSGLQELQVWGKFLHCMLVTLFTLA